ncbi:MAG: M4 family metallopeptidase [Gammaproteobacteria bacterium]|nr:M4 family metallopeptidase [Gammaproteobacteria bacterium]
MTTRPCLNCITPPHILTRLLDSRDDAIRAAALRTFLATERLRGERAVRSLMGITAAGPSSGRRTVYDCHRRRILPAASIAHTEDGPASSDASVNRAFDGLGDTRGFFLEIFERNSIDGNGMRLEGYVHFGNSYNNAFWDGREMVFGDGDGRIFTDFTRSLDVIGHELSHGVTEHTAGLEYHGQSGALNESMSDVFGSLVKQWKNRQSAAEADWLIGAEILTPEIDADALRSMKAPGQAYDNPLLGKDPQPAHMRDFVELPDTEEGDFGGVHINSGIPNHAFYLAATAIGGYAWEAPGHVWYQALLASHQNTGFSEFASTTVQKAGELYGNGSDVQKAVYDAWAQVGIRSGSRPGTPSSDQPGEQQPGLIDVVTRLDTLIDEVRALSAELQKSRTR